MGVLIRTIACLVCAAMLLPGFVVLSTAVRNVEGAAPIRLIVGIPQTVDNLNPLVGYNNIDYQSYILQFDFLYHFDKNFNPVPAAAQSWFHNEDGKIWTFQIRQGMTFHDGVPVTAEDVNWTFNLMLNDPVAGSLYVDLLRNITSVRAPDATTLEITSNAPKANMLGLMIPILPKHLWSQVPSNKLTSVDLWDPSYFPNGPVGSGPFRLVRYETDSFILYAKYPGYYGGTVHFDELMYNIYVNPQVMLNELIAGTIDLACMLPKESWDVTVNRDDIDGQVVPQLTFHELGFNVCPPELRVGGASTNYETLNRSVRMATAMAINKTEILKNSYFGLGEEGDTIIPPASVFYHYNVTESERYKFDIAKANALLDASGYIDSDSDGIRENSTNGAELSFNYLYATEYPEDQTAATRISRSLADIGISATPVGELESQLYVDWVGMKYDMFMWNWGTDVDPTFILSVMTTAQIPTSHNDWAAWSDSFYSNPVYDQMFAQQQTTIDPAARQQIVFDMQRMLYKDSPYVVLAYPYGLYAYRVGPDARFTNWPVIESDAISPFSGTGGGPWFYLQILPVGANLPPRDVSSGADTTVALNETRSFTGSAYDPDNDTLTWSWEFSEPNGTSYVRTGKTVSYTFKNVGAVTVTLSVSDGINPAVTSHITVTVVYIPDAGLLEGYVKDAHNAPVEGALVAAASTSDTTDSAGYYAMTLAVGTYTVNATAQGFSSASEPGVVIVKGETTVQNFTLTSTSGTLKGHIYDSVTGAGLANVTISATVSGVTKVGVSNVTGAYRILLIPAGTCSITAAKTGYETNTTSAQIVAGEDTTLNIELTLVTKGKGLSTNTWMIIAGVVVAAGVGVVVALTLMKRKKDTGPA